jgi:hypothetical protein
MRCRFGAILMLALLAACTTAAPEQPPPSGAAVTPTPTPAASATAQPTPSPTPTVEPLPTATPAPTIAYDCPLLTLDEITAIVGREISNAYQTERGGCMWNFQPDAGAPGGSVSLHVSPWDATVFNPNYRTVPAERRFADVGDGAYWDDRGFLVFLQRDHVCGVTFTLGEGEADQVQLSIDIAQAAIPRMFLD